MQTFFDEDNFYDTPIDDESATDTCMLGFSNTTGENIDGFIVEPIREKLFQRENLTAGLDLVALNIQRGRDHGTGSELIILYHVFACHIIIVSHRIFSLLSVW